MSTTGATTSTEERALILLGDGIPAETVASALGVHVSRISQLMSDDTFKEQVLKLRFENLSKHNRRDSRYDTLEDQLIDRLEPQIDLMYNPAMILKAISVINAAKRRGTSAPESMTQQHTLVQLIIPTKVINHFTANINNEVVRIGDKDLTTIQSGTLLNQLKERIKAKVTDAQNSPPSPLLIEHDDSQPHLGEQYGHQLERVEASAGDR